MDGFVATFTNRLDQKGRVSVPAPFRAVLAREGQDGLYCYPALDRPAIDGGGARLQEAIDEAPQHLRDLLGGSRKPLHRLLRREPHPEDRSGRARGPARRSSATTPASATSPSSSARASSSRSGSRAASPSGSARRARICAPSRAGSANPIPRLRAGGARHDGGPRLFERGCRRTGPPRARPPARGARVARRHRRRPLHRRHLRRRRHTAPASSSAAAVCSPSTATAPRSRRAQALAAASGGRLIARRGPLLRPRGACARARISSRSTASCSMSASPPCSSTIRRAASPSARDGPLDMRMGADGADAAAVVNGATAKELATIIGVLGEEKKAGRIARAIERARAEAPIERTARLAEIVAAAVGPTGLRIHPATRTFQALRIFVNRELEELARALCRRRDGAARRRAARRRRLPFARGPHREALPAGALERRARLAPCAARRMRRRRPSRSLTRHARRAGRGGDRRQSARPLGAAAGPRSAPPRPRARSISTQSAFRSSAASGVRRPMHDALAAAHLRRRRGGRRDLRVPGQVSRRSGRGARRPTCSARSTARTRRCRCCAPSGAC